MEAPVYFFPLPGNPGAEKPDTGPKRQGACMTRRIYKTRFAFYIFWISVPFFLAGLLLAIYPDPALSRLFPQQELPGLIRMVARAFGAMLVYVGLTLILMKREPDRNRELAFWQAVLCIGLGVLVAASPWLFSMTYWVLPAAVYLIAAGAFLFTFASRNLLVRE